MTCLFHHFLSGWMTTNLRVGMTSWVYDLSSCTGLHNQKDPMLSLMLYSYHLDILNFIFECVISKRMMGAYTQDNMCSVPCFSILIQCSPCPMNTELQWINDSWEFSKTQSTQQTCFFDNYVGLLVTREATALFVPELASQIEGNVIK